MIPRAIAPLALAALVATLPAAASDPGLPGVTLLEPTGFVILNKHDDSIRFRWQVPMPLAKSLWPGKSFWAAPHFSVEGKTFDLKVEYRTPAVPESGIVEVRVFAWQIHLAGKEVGFDFTKPCTLTWRVDIRPKNQGGNLMTAQGSRSVDARGRSALGVSPDTWGNAWPSSFKVTNSAFWSSNPTSLKVTVKRLDEDQEVVRRHCPIRIADFEAPVPKVLYQPAVVQAKKPSVSVPPGASAQISAKAPIAKVIGGVQPGPTPTPPVVQQVVNCRFLVTMSLPREDNPEDQRMTPAGIRNEVQVNITVPLK